MKKEKIYYCEKCDIIIHERFFFISIMYGRTLRLDRDTGEYIIGPLHNTCLNELKINKQ